MNNKIMPTTFEKVVMILLVTGPVLNIYGTPTSMSLSQMLTFLLAVIYFGIFVIKGRNKREKLFWSGLGLYFLYRGVTTILSGSSIISIIEQFLGFFMAFGCFQRDYYIKTMKIFAGAAIVFFFIQFFGHLATGVQISGIIPFLPMHEDVDMSEFMYNKAHAERSSAFFSEPSHLAQFIIPFLAIELFYDKNKRHYWYAVIVFVVILLLQSGTGYVGLIPLVAFMVLYLLRDSKIKGFGRVLTLFGFIIVVAGVSYVFMNSDMGTGILDRSDELSSEYQGGSRSGFLRIWRGYFVFADYSPIEMIFGVADSDAVLAHVKRSGMSFGIKAELYFNAIQDILLYTGFVGLLLFFFVLRQIWKGNTICGKAIVGSLIAIMLVEHIYFSNVMLVHLLLAEGMKEKYSLLPSFNQSPNR